MASRWIVKRGEKEGGPFTSPELRSLADSGQLRRTDLVTRQGSNRFVKAEEVKGLEFPPASEELEYGRVKIYEEEPVIVIDPIDDPMEEPAIVIHPVEEPVIVIDAVEEPAVVDYDYDANDDFEEPEPASRPRSRNQRGAVAAVRSGGSRRSSRLEPFSRKSNPARNNANEEEVGSAAWMHLFAGVMSIAVCIGFISSKNDANGGRSTFIATFLALATNFIYQSIKKFTRR